MRRSNWDNGVHKIDGLALGFDLTIYDMHDDCGRWLHLDLNLLKINIEIARYLGPTRDPYTDADKKIIIAREDELCASCAGTLSGRAADSKSDGGGFESPPALRSDVV